MADVMATVEPTVDAGALATMQKLAADMGGAQAAPAPVTAPAEAAPAPVVDAPAPVEPVAAQKEEQPVAKPEELEKALTALRRSKLPQKVLDAMSPQELIALGAEHQRFWGEKDDSYRQLSELKKSAKAAPEKPVEERREDPISAGTPQALTLFAEIKGELGDVVAESMAKDVERYVNDRVSREVQAIADKLASLTQAYEPLAVEHARAQMDSARQRLASKYEGLKDDTKFASVFQTMSRFDHTKYENLDQMIDDASRIVFADDLVAAAARAKEASKQEERQRDAGQPLSATSNREARKLSEMERATEAMRLLSEGKTPDEITRLLGT